MNGFIISILSFAFLTIRSFCADKLKSTAVSLLITKKISLILIITIFFAVETFSQTSGEGMKKIDGCFSAVKIDVKTSSISISKTFCVGDKITVKLKDDKIHGKISKLSKDYIVMADNSEIDVSKIKWIKKSKLTASRAIVSVLMAAAGVALIATSQEGENSYGETGALVLTGAALVPVSIVIFVSRTKFRIERGDKLIFVDPPNQVNQVKL